MAEGIRREDDLVTVRSGLAMLGRMHDAGVQKQAVQTRATAHGRGGRTHRPEVAGVEQKRLDRGIRNQAPHRSTSGCQPVRIATGHDDVPTRSGELQRREEPQPGRRTRDEVPPALEVGEAVRVPIVACHETETRPPRPR